MTHALGSVSHVGWAGPGAVLGRKAGSKYADASLLPEGHHQQREPIFL